MDNLILAGNLISAIGVFFLIFGHHIISKGKENQGIKLSVTGGAFVATGAVFLTSWPIFGLNIVWMGIGLYGLYHRGKTENINNLYNNKNYYNLFFLALFLIGMIFSVLGQYNIAAWFCTALYLFAFAFFSHKRIDNFQYMIWTFLGFFLLLEHLIIKQNYSVLVNETIGAIISFKGMLFLLKKTKQEKQVETL
jgi:hypothetical protein